MGFDDPTDLATQIWYSELGDEAPADFKQQTELTKAQQRIDALEKRLEESNQKAEEARQRAAYDAQVNALDADLGKMAQEVNKDEFPFLAKMSKESPQDTYEAMVSVALGQINEGSWVTAQEVARLLEAGLEKTLSPWLKDQKEPAETKTTETKSFQ